MPGFVKKLGRKIDRLAGVGIERTFLYRMTADQGRPPATRGIEWELVSPIGLAGLAEIGPFDVEDGVWRLERGDRCYTVSLDGRLTHYSWVQRSGLHQITEAAASVEVASGDFWIYNCRTAHWARGKGIYPATLERITADHFANGCNTAWIYTSQHNISSQRGILRAGFGQVQTLSALRVGRRYVAAAKQIPSGV